MEEFKKSAMERYIHQKELDYQRQRYLELTEKINSARDKQTRSLLTKELKSLSPVSTTLPSSSSLESLQERARELHRLLREREDELLAEEFEASMLCQVDRLNLLTLLRVFEVEVDLGEGDDEGGGDDRHLVSKLTEQLMKLERELLEKVGWADG
jgi:hypothetical protein